MAQMSLQTKPSPKPARRSVPPTPPHSTPKRHGRKKTFYSPQAYSISVSTGDINSLTPNGMTDFIVKYGIIDPEVFLTQDGTKSNPYITFVDKDYPECNGCFHGCDITH
eukprot:5309327-Ditylum_brightwellii.AAC.1